MIVSAIEKLLLSTFVFLWIALILVSPQAVAVFSSMLFIFQLSVFFLALFFFISFLMLSEFVLCGWPHQLEL